MQLDDNDSWQARLADDGAIYEIRDLPGAADSFVGGTAEAEPAGVEGRQVLFSPELQRESEKHLHLKKYLASLPIDDIGVPEYRSRLAVQDRDTEYKNLIYPVDRGVLVHIYPGIGGDRDCYVPVSYTHLTLPTILLV